MKKLATFILIAIGAFSLPGCKAQEPVLDPGQTGMTGSINPNENPEENSQNNTESENDNSQEPNEAAVYEPVTGDNLTVAAEFAKDLLDENFPKLIQSYQYDDKMKAAMAAGDTKKTVYFYNAEYGKFEDMNKAYALSVGAYQYVMIPVECSVSNFNYQIVFDGNHNIVGFTYGEYVPKEATGEDKIPDGVTEEEYTFYSDGYVIPGTLTRPEEGSRFPIVILVQGSGASDRDESIYENKPFRDIAWALAGQGIASYRYDKRSYLYAEQTAEDVTATIEDEIIDDVIAAADMVKKLEYADLSHIYILGHSLGGYAIPRIAQNLTDISGYIMMAAPAQHLKEYSMDQYEFLADEDESITAEEQAQLNTLTEQIKLLNKPKNIPENEVILGAYKDYWIDLAKYYPIKTAKKIKVPVLVLQGERDYQVTMDQFNIWKTNFKDSGNWIFKSYTSLNHFMMAGTGLPNSEEYKTHSHVGDLVIQDIIQFIKNKVI
ncbi:MAG: prolyl oligopeptidase family serine peptidase [Anaerocolumna sp.]